MVFWLWNEKNLIILWKILPEAISFDIPIYLYSSVMHVADTLAMQCNYIQFMTLL